MTELMKRYEDGGDIEYLDFLENENVQLKSLVKQLKAQLTWRPVSEKPERDGLYNIKFTRDDSIKVFTGSADYDEAFEDEEKGFDGWYDIPPNVRVTHWLPIPPAPEGE